MRFRLQYRDGDRWRYVKGADSAWRILTKARGRRVESGWTFSFGTLTGPTTFRGIVRYQWRREGPRGSQRLVFAPRRVFCDRVGRRHRQGRRLLARIAATAWAWCGGG